MLVVVRESIFFKRKKRCIRGMEILLFVIMYDWFDFIDFLL